MKRSIAAVTDNRPMGLLVGIVATTLLDASSATIIIAISLVRAGQILWIARLLERLIPDGPRQQEPGGPAALGLRNT